MLVLPDIHASRASSRGSSVAGSRPCSRSGSRPPSRTGSPLAARETAQTPERKLERPRSGSFDGGPNKATSAIDDRLVGMPRGSFSSSFSGSRPGSRSDSPLAARSMSSSVGASPNKPAFAIDGYSPVSTGCSFTSTKPLSDDGSVEFSRSISLAGMATVDSLSIQTEFDAVDGASQKLEKLGCKETQSISELSKPARSSSLSRLKAAKENWKELEKNSCPASYAKPPSKPQRTETCKDQKDATSKDQVSVEQKSEPRKSRSSTDVRSSSMEASKASTKGESEKNNLTGYVKPPSKPQRAAASTQQKEVLAEPRRSRTKSVADVRSSSAEPSKGPTTEELEKMEPDQRLFWAACTNDIKMVKVLAVRDRASFMKHVNHAILYASKAGSCDAVRVMCQYGGSLNAKDASGRTVWDYAQQSPNPEVLTEVLSKINDPSASDDIKSIFSKADQKAKQDRQAAEEMKAASKKATSIIRRKILLPSRSQTL